MRYHYASNSGSIPAQGPLLILPLSLSLTHSFPVSLSFCPVLNKGIKRVKTHLKKTQVTLQMLRGQRVRRQDMIIAQSSKGLNPRLK